MEHLTKTSIDLENLTLPDNEKTKNNAWVTIGNHIYVVPH